MRTLIIDNYDSYTYNLYHLIGSVTGDEPVVIAHDRLDDPEWVNEFDLLVISPGPGHPGVPRDFSGSSAALEAASIPVLGVCLGHQGIGFSAGGAVVRAPEPSHGHVTTVTHNDDAGMFRGIPKSFSAVRYHSLCLEEPLPDGLIATAWAEDGVIMAVRSVDAPRWGVQFHPESILSEYGAQLIKNFTRVGPPSGRAPVKAVDPPVEEVLPLPSRAPRILLQDLQLIEDAVDTKAAFEALFSAADNAIWLDSAGSASGEARFSVLGAVADAGELVTYQVEEDHVSVQTGSKSVRTVAGTIFDYLQERLRARVVVGTPLPFDFVGSYFGYFGYELKADTVSAANAHTSITPDAQWLAPDRLVIVDHRDRRTYLIALTATRPKGAGLAAGAALSRRRREARTWLTKARAALARAAAVQTDLSMGQDRPAVTDTSADYQPNVEWARTREQYIDDIEACKAKLRAGESYEICLTTSARIREKVDGQALFEKLKVRNPAPYSAFLRLGAVEVACSSPERFLAIDREGWVESKPIKGTAPRSGSPTIDEQLREALRTDPKTRAENLMIVDLLRNDLGRVCSSGTVTVPNLMVTESYATVHQLVSTVRGRLRPGFDAIDCVRACFPGGSMTGAPKRRTLEIIDSLEPEARGVYSGSIGYLSPTGAADLNIVIRTAVREDDTTWRVGAGGAIVLHSDPSDEHDEVLLKASALLETLTNAVTTERPGDLGEGYR